MSILKLAFQTFQSMGRDLSAKDLQVRLPIECANPNKLTAALREQGCIERSFRQGREQFYKLVPGAVPPSDARPVAVVKAREVRLRKFRMARMARLRKGRA